MYCSNCGNAATSDLKYCKNCGERLAKEMEDKDGTPGKMLDNILTTLFLVVMFGLGILVGLVAVLMDKSIETKYVVMIAVAYLGAIFGICYTLLSQVPKLVDAKLNRNRPASAPDFVPPVQLNARTTAQLDEYHQPASSITEHTTKTLEEVPARRT
jgi:F0F1-type ATP synthase assembly protein I